MATTALTFNVLSAMDAGDEAYGKIMAMSHAPSMKLQAQILKARYDAGKGGGLSAAQRAVKDVIEDAGSADLLELTKEVAKERAAAHSGSLNPYLALTIDGLKADFAAWLAAVIPAVAGNANTNILDNGGAVAQGGADIAAANYAAGDPHPLVGTVIALGDAMIGTGKPSGGNYAVGDAIEAALHAADPLVGTPNPLKLGSVAALAASNAGHNIAAAKPANRQAVTFIGAVNAVLDALKDNAILSVAQYVAGSGVGAHLVVPNNVSTKTTSALRANVIAAVSLTIQEYVDDLMGGSANDGARFLSASPLLVAPAGVITSVDMIPAGRSAAEFKLALDAFLTKQ